MLSLQGAEFASFLLRAFALSIDLVAALIVLAVVVSAIAVYPMR